MRTRRLLIALLVFLLPLSGRLLWFYRGFPDVQKDLPDPGYGGFDLPQPDTSDPNPTDFNSSVSPATILIDQAHGNLFTLTEIEPLHSELLLQGASVITADNSIDFLNDLQKATAIAIITPTDEYSEREIEAIEEFVARGGRLLVTADPTRSNAEHIDDKARKIAQLNQLLNTFSLSFNNDYVYNLHQNEGNFRNVYVRPAADQTEITSGLNSVVFYGSHSLGLFKSAAIIGDGNTLSSLTDKGDGLPVAALDDSGNVFAIGDMTFMTSPYHQVADNYRLIQNIASYLINAQRSKSLDDFPNLFDQNIGILLNSGIVLDKDLLEVLSNLQADFAKDDLQISLLEASNGDIDEIVLGIYPPDDALELITDPLGFEYQNGERNGKPTVTPTDEVESDTPAVNPDKDDVETSESSSRMIIVPEFGAIPREGFGFLLFDTSEGRNRLILLADSQENCINLLNLLYAGSLEGCLVGKQVAICEQDIKFNGVIEEEITPTPADENGEPEELIPAPEETEVPATPTPTETPQP